MCGTANYFMRIHRNLKYFVNTDKTTGSYDLMELTTGRTVTFELLDWWNLALAQGSTCNPCFNVHYVGLQSTLTTIDDLTWLQANAIDQIFEVTKVCTPSLDGNNYFDSIAGQITISLKPG